MKSSDTFMGAKPGQLVKNDADDVFVFYGGGLANWYDTWYVGKINDTFVFSARTGFSLFDLAAKEYFAVSENFSQKKPIKVNFLWSSIKHALQFPANFDVLADEKLDKQKAMHSAFVKNSTNNKSR